MIVGRCLGAAAFILPWIPFGESKPPPYGLTFLLFYEHRITDMYGI